LGSSFQRAFLANTGSEVNVTGGAFNGRFGAFGAVVNVSGGNYVKQGHIKHHFTETAGCSQPAALINMLWNRDPMCHTHTNYQGNGLPLALKNEIFNEHFGPFTGDAIDGGDAVDAVDGGDAVDDPADEGVVDRSGRHRAAEGDQVRDEAVVDVVDVSHRASPPAGSGRRRQRAGRPRVRAGRGAAGT